MKRVFAAIAFLALAGCGPQASTSYPAQGAAEELAVMGGERAAAEAPAPAPMVEAAADKPAPLPPPPGQPSAPGTPPGGVLLAYAYTFGLEVQPLMKKHAEECTRAGANLCQVLGSSTNSNGENYVNAELQIRAEPRWLAAFRGKLEGDARGVGGELKSESVTTEDLTRDIVDTEARLRAKRTLRDRLQNLLASRPGKLSDLLDVERELANVQGEIDSTESNLAVMRARVSMSVATLNYSSAGAPLTDRTFEPIKQALTNFTRIFAEVVGFMISAIAVILPWLLLLWLVVWLMRGWVRRRRAAKAAKAAVTAPT
jgi:hypothetical protein